MRVLIAAAAAGQAIVAWVVGQTSGDSVDGLLTQLGAFAVAAAVGAWFTRDLIVQRNRLQQANDASMPVMVEIRDALRHNTDALRASAEAIKAMADALGRVPSDAEIIRLRDALERVSKG